MIWSPISRRSINHTVEFCLKLSAGIEALKWLLGEFWNQSWLYKILEAMKQFFMRICHHKLLCQFPQKFSHYYMGLEEDRSPVLRGLFFKKWLYCCFLISFTFVFFLQRLVDRLLYFGIHDNKASGKGTSMSAVLKEISAALFIKLCILIQIWKILNLHFMLNLSFQLSIIKFDKNHKINNIIQK